MLLVALVTVLPALATAQITINVNLGEDVTQSKVEVVGSITEILSDSERKKWTLSDNQLKDAVYRLSGARPDDVYLNMLTPWELYINFNWREVERTVSATGAMIHHVIHEPMSLIGETFFTHSIDRDEAVLFRNVYLESSHFWKIGNQLTVRDNVTYNFNLSRSLSTTEQNFSLSFLGRWGQVGSNSVTFFYGNSLKDELNQFSKGELKGELYAKKTIVIITVDYKATLEGYVACNFKRINEGHDFEAFDVNDCLKAAGSPTEITDRETIEISFLSHGKLVITNTTTSKTISRIPAVIIKNKF